MNKNTIKRAKKYSHLSLQEREEIAICLENRMKRYEIALLLGRSTSTISREIRRNSPVFSFVRYRASTAQLRTEERKKNSHKRQRIPNRKLKRFICNNLKKGYSPEIIAFLVTEKNSRWKTNHETIYQWIYKERQDLIPFLVRGHKKRRKRGTAKQKRCPKVPNRIMIEKRPMDVNLRSRIGDWEADTIISRQSKVAVMVLVNRKARFTILRKLDGKDAYSMHKAIVQSLISYPQRKRLSITYDNGTENTLHKLTNKKLGSDSYFCNPYHSWERGTVENIIGIVRWFYSKKTDWKHVTQWDLNKVSRFINNRPMKCLGNKTPYQVFVALAA